MKEPRTPLQRVLREQGRRQKWLAEQIGKHESTVSQIAHGLIPDDDTAQKIADALGRRVDELWPPFDERRAA